MHYFHVLEVQVHRPPLPPVQANETASKYWTDMEKYIIGKTGLQYEYIEVELLITDPHRLVRLALPKWRFIRFSILKPITMLRSATIVSSQPIKQLALHSAVRFCKQILESRNTLQIHCARLLSFYPETRSISNQRPIT
jgi:hypothetical protein